MGNVEGEAYDVNICNSILSNVIQDELDNQDSKKSSYKLQNLDIGLFLRRPDA